eukprot:4484382-Prymnesium_polylepis.1
MMRLHLPSVMGYADERALADGPLSEGKKYVNVAGGREGAAELGAVVRVLHDSGLFASLVPGPFLI